MDIPITELSYNQKNYIKMKDYYIKYRADHRDKQKEYNDKNKDIMKEYHKKRYQEIKVKLFTKATCECGSKVCASAMARHCLTPRHVVLLQKIKQAEEEELLKQLKYIILKN